MKYIFNKNIINIAEENKTIKQLTSKKLLLSISTLLVLILLIAPLIISVYESKNLNNYDANSTIFNENILNNEPKIFITDEEFNQITEGMSYDEVCSIIGGEGELIQTIDFGLGEEQITRIYEWKSETDDLAFANIVLKNNIVLSKTQSNLITE